MPSTLLPKHPDGLTLRYWREMFYEYCKSHWRLIHDSDMKCMIAKFCKRQLDIDNLRALSEWNGQGDRPTVAKVTVTLVNSVIQALAGEVRLSSHASIPCWIGKNGPESRKYLATANGILDLDAYLARDDEALRPHSPRW